MDNILQAIVFTLLLGWLTVIGVGITVVGSLAFFWGLLKIGKRFMEED